MMTPEDPPLGELEFDEWFGTPLFEPDREERLEEMATSGRGPARLVAAAWVRISARAAGPRPARKNASMKQRISRALDRWAEKEAAGQVRLERIMLPRRWRA